MPRVGQPTRSQLARAAWAEFESGFQRSRKGNLWRTWRRVTLSIFERADGYYGWSIANDDGPRFSAAGYETEAEAMWALGRELSVSDVF